jgi:hypothetical protein
MTTRNRWFPFSLRGALFVMFVAGWSFVGFVAFDWLPFAVGRDRPVEIKSAIIGGVLGGLASFVIGSIVLLAGTKLSPAMLTLLGICLTALIPILLWVSFFPADFLIAPAWR